MLGLLSYDASTWQAPKIINRTFHVGITKNWGCLVRSMGGQWPQSSVDFASPLCSLVILQRPLSVLLCSFGNMIEEKSVRPPTIYILQHYMYVFHFMPRPFHVARSVGTSSGSSSFTARFYKGSLKVSKARARNVRNELDFRTKIIK